MNLIFLAPLAFLGLLSLSVPIYLHMRHRPRAISYRFSALEFLLRAQRKRQRRVNVEQLFLMLLRLAVLLALVFLFARPFRESARMKAGISSPLFFILDDSASMLAGETRQSVFQQAIDLMTDQLQNLSPDHQTYFFLASDPGKHASIHTALELKNLLPKLKPTCLRTTLDEAYQLAVEVVAQEKLSSAQFEILSDHRYNSWEVPPPAPGPAIQVHLNQFKIPQENAGLTEVRPLGGGHAESGFEIQVFNASPVKKSIDLSIKMAARKWDESIPLAPQAPTSHRFTLPSLTSKSSVPETITFELPHDQFTLDNRQTIPVKSYKTPRILLVDGDPNPILEQSEGYYLGLALHTALPDSIKRVSSSGLTRERLEWADILFLLNVDDPPEALLSEALALGKSIMVACGNRVNPEAWNPFLHNAGLQFWDWTRLPEPAMLALPDNLDQSHRFDFFQASQFPLYFGETFVRENQMITLESPKLKPFLTLQDGSPLLLGGVLQKGRIMVWTTSLDLDGSNLPIQAGFVPLIQSMVDYLFFAEQKIELEYLTISELLGKEPQNLVMTEVWDNHSASDVSGPLPGMYHWNLSDGVTRYGAIRLDPEESNFQGSLEGEGSSHQQTPFPESFQKTQRTDLGHSIAWILFTAILAETILAAKISEKWGGR